MGVTNHVWSGGDQAWLVRGCASMVGHHNHVLHVLHEETGPERGGEGFKPFPELRASSWHRGATWFQHEFVEPHPRARARRDRSPARGPSRDTRATAPSRRGMIEEPHSETSEPACLVPLPLHPRHILKFSRQTPRRAAGLDPACPAPDGVKACPAPSDAILAACESGRTVAVRSP